MGFDSKDRTILLTFDVEDWFQVENFKEYIPYSSWPARELRVEKNTLGLLDLLDEAPFPIKATFFVLGWIAEACPDLIREIHHRGHEVASHGCDHHLCYTMKPDDLVRDLNTSKKMLEEVIGSRVYGYRAPSFSISDDILALVHKAGYLYDSSYNSYQGHGRYGSLTLPKSEEGDLPCYPVAASFYEIPVSNLRLAGRIVPWGGGGYFRLLPFSLYMAGVRRILADRGCYTFYMHPWEIDPGQPRVKEARALFRFRHYVNLGKTKDKLKRFLADSAGCPFLTCRELVEKAG